MRYNSISAVAASVSFLWNSINIPASYDFYSPKYNFLNTGVFTKSFGIDDLRGLAGKESIGSVLEVAVGTGIQIPYYKWDQISNYIGVDISEGMLREAKRVIPPSLQRYQLKNMDVMTLDFGDNEFDTVLDSFSLCVISDPAKAISEMDRVVKRPNGRIILLENTKSQIPIVGLFQDITEPVVTPLSKQCRWNINVARLADEAGLKLLTRENAELGTISFSIYSPSRME